MTATRRTCELATYRRKLNAELKRVDASFVKHLEGTNAWSSCTMCREHWGELRGLKNALELTKKKPNLQLEIT